MNNTNNHTENNLYCSIECKNKCSIFISNGSPLKLSASYGLKIWAIEIFRRANNLCEICWDTAEQAHHIIPKKLEPFYALDPTNVVALCKICHLKYGHTDECSFTKLASIECVSKKGIKKYEY